MQGFVATPAPHRGGTFRQVDDSHDGTDDSAGTDTRGADAAARRRPKATGPGVSPAAKAPAKTAGKAPAQAAAKGRTKAAAPAAASSKPARTRKAAR